jgi:hypothetical protein
VKKLESNFAAMTAHSRKVKGFYTKKGKRHPVTAKATTTHTASGGRLTYAAIQKSRRPRMKRILARKERARLSTLQNEMIYRPFLEKLKKLNEDFDEQLIDRTLEPHEALMALKRKHPHISIGLTTDDQAAGFREFLEDFGITNAKVQNMIAMEDNPLSEQELAQLSYILNNRPEHSLKTDRGLKAPIARNLRRYIKHPNRLDLPGVDTRR